ncbi:PEP-utilizing enzyme [Nanoarchaeota archaeon]
MKEKSSQYEFSWGEQHSVISTESWLRGYVYLRDIIANENKNVFMYVEKGTVHTYNATQDYPSAHNAGKIIVEKGFIVQHLKKSRLIRVSFNNFVKKINSRDLKKLSNGELSEFLNQYQELYDLTWAYFKISQPEYLEIAKERLEKLLEKNLGKKEAVQAFITLTTPTEIDLIKEEEISAIELSFKNNLMEKDFLDHGEKFPWLFFNTYDKSVIIEFLRKKFSDWQEIPKQKRQKQLGELNQGLEEHQKKYQNILAQIKDKEEVERLSKIFGSLAIDRLKLKKWWGGAEYLFLNFFKEISNRLDIAVKDLFMTYRFEEMMNFLENGKTLSKDEMTQREETYAFYLKEGILKFDSGQKAYGQYYDLIGKYTKKHKSVNTIFGTPASVGKVKGRARIIKVEDLERLLDDVKHFQKGDIMITTMTQPTMVMLARRAAAIVTNEGGITSHASILAREFNIPCIVGTKIATEVIKDGDMIEVDADKGVVKIIKE